MNSEQLEAAIKQGGWKLDPAVHRQLAARYIHLVEEENQDPRVADPTFFVGDFMDTYLETTGDVLPPLIPSPVNTVDGELLDPDVVSQLMSDFDTPVQRSTQQQWGGQQYDLDRHLVFTPSYQQRVRRLNVTGTAYEVHFHNMDTVDNVNAFMHQALERMLDEAYANAAPNDRVGIQIRHPGLRAPINIPFRRRDQMNAETIMRVVEDVKQSALEFDMDDEMTWQFTHLGTPSGAGRFRFRGDVDVWVESRSGHGGSLININNADNLCLARALVTAKVRLLRAGNKKLWEAVRKGDSGRHTKQRELAQQLMLAAGLQNHQGPCGLPELARLHAAMGNHYRVRVFSSEAAFNVIYDEGRGITMDLLLHHHHYYVITTITGFFGKAYWCDTCRVAYNHKHSHTACGSKCPCCFDKEPCTADNWIHCTDCNRWFANDECYAYHRKLEEKIVTKGAKKQKIQVSTCTQVQKCDGCGKTVYARKTSDHECGKKECRHCGEQVDPAEHLCHMQPAIDPKPLQKDKVNSLIFYDMETSQDTIVASDEHGDVFEHVVNCVCVRKLCDQCYGSPAECKNCGTPGKMKFVGDNALEKFCKWLFSPVNVGSAVIAHNSGGFDGQFILRWLRKQAIVPEPIMRGLKIVKLWAPTAKILLLDSFNFMPMALSAFPKAWGFDAAKGTFPHLFNTRDNWNYVGELPDACFYGPATMKPKAREEFYRWYNAEKAKGEPFDFQKALVLYCELDVDILVTGCMKFRELLMKEHGVDPFACASTIASTCMHIYRKHFVPPESIAIVPHLGYRKLHRHSTLAIKWLKWISEEENLDIQHARNGGEVRINRYRVDGQNRSDPKQLYEFYGCVFHGCPRCLPDRRKQLPLSTLTAAEAYDQTMDRERELSGLGYTIRSLWECELHRQLNANQEMKTFFKSVDVGAPLDPREAFYGGRTNCRKMYHRCSDGERIQYIDICSLYPFCCKYGRFPVGHPTVITENFEPVTADDHPYEGLMKCTVLPPKNLLHPVLPSRVGGKLLFHLCRSCAEDRREELCDHDDDERQISGTWATCELYKALDMGYAIVSIAEVYHFDRWEQYDGHDPTTGFFTGYINSFLKTKQEASGWPSWAETDDQRDQYLRQYFEHEGIQLDKSRIEKNPGLRSLSKLGLNSFWGKFGQRPMLMKTKYFSDAEVQQFYKLVFDPAVEVHAIEVVGTHMVMVQYVSTDDYVEETDNTNPIIAAWVTAQARLKLYSHLEPLGDRVLYMDTDSVIYLNRPGDSYQPPMGDFLGDMTDELDGGYISEFVAAGPKQYGYICKWDDSEKTETCVKIRGFTLSSAAAKQLNFKTLKRMVLAFLRDQELQHVAVTAPAIRRQRDHSIVTRTVRKTYSVVYDKCRVLPSGVTVPFGYVL